MWIWPPVRAPIPSCWMCRSPYVKRPIPLDDQGNVVTSDARELITFDIGADLYVRDRASPSAADRNITTSITQGLGAVRDLEASFDGEKVIFAMRTPFDPDAQEEDLPKWNIWQYDLVNDQLTRIIASDITAEAGHDVAPHYLPDGRIVFSSTRQRQSGAILLDEGKPQFAALDENRNEMAFVLHVMNDDGSDIHQVSFNQSHDLDPTVLSNGQVAFSRWDNMGGRNAIQPVSHESRRHRPRVALRCKQPRHGHGRRHDSVSAAARDVQRQLHDDDQAVYRRQFRQVTSSLSKFRITSKIFSRRCRTRAF